MPTSLGGCTQAYARLSGRLPYGHSPCHFGGRMYPPLDSQGLKGHPQRFRSPHR